MTTASTSPLSPQASRALALLLLLLAIVLGLALLIAPVFLLHLHYDANIETMRDQLDRYRRVAAQAPETKKAARWRFGRRMAVASS